MLRRILLFASALVLASCQSAPPPPAPSPKPSPTRPVDVGPLPPAAIERPASFRELPNWDVAPIELPLSAFKRSCVKLQDRSAGDFMANVAPWAGYVAEWLPACDAVNDAQDDESARRILESLFTPVEISDPSGKSRFTGYFEPLYEARHTPTPPFTEPVPALPADLVPNGASPKQRLRNGALRPYPSRAEITTSGVSAIAYAHPADVFFLQIQGSGRLRFPDGRTVRAAYAAHNGHPFRSTANWLMETGRITAGEASMQGIRAWMDRAGPVETRMAMNQNPRFVFFRALPEGDAALGPEGAQAVPLTPLSSMAVDTDIHPLGVPIPHTAIIPRKKDRIADTMAQFLRANFLTPSVVARRMRRTNVAANAGEFLVNREGGERSRFMGGGAGSHRGRQDDQNDDGGNHDAHAFARGFSVPPHVLAPKSGCGRPVIEDPDQFGGGR